MILTCLDELRIDQVGTLAIPEIEIRYQNTRVADHSQDKKYRIYMTNEVIISRHLQIEVLERNACSRPDVV